MDTASKKCNICGKDFQEGHNKTHENVLPMVLFNPLFKKVTRDEFFGRVRSKYHLIQDLHPFGSQKVSSDSDDLIDQIQIVESDMKENNLNEILENIDQQILKEDETFKLNKD